MLPALVQALDSLGEATPGALAEDLLDGFLAEVDGAVGRFLPQLEQALARALTAAGLFAIGNP